MDDGSSDNTDEVVGDYVKKYSRFKYYHRPDAHKAGGNGARNYGFEMSRGEFVNWFDSDDLMHSEKLEIKVQAIVSSNVDFVISKTKYFNNPNDIPYPYNYYDDEICFLSFSTTYISWYTPDMLIKRDIARKVSFNEIIKAGQEYNYICKLLLITRKAKKINRFLTQRRYSETSIGNNRRQTKGKYLYSRFQSYWLNYLEISQLVDNSKFNKHSLLVCISCYFQSRNGFKLPPTFNKEVRCIFSKKSIYFYLAKYSNFLFGKYHFFYNKLKN